MNSSRSDSSYGQKGLTIVDRFGVWLSQKAILESLKDSRNLDVLEVGCGYNATLLLSLNRYINKAVGIDFKISSDIKGIPKYEFREGNAGKILPELVENSFDAVLLISVLEHLENPLDILLSILRVMRPGASLIINVPTWFGKKFLEFSAFRLGLSPKIEIDDHKMYYDKKDLWPLLVKSGFKPSCISMRYHKFGMNLFAQIKNEK
jgi:SAM-dependent methyltransferase